MTIIIQRDYIPGAMGRITELHARYYHRHWGFGLYFEAKVASDLLAFMQHYQPERDGLWLAVQDGQIVGSIALDRQHSLDAAHLRWFILDDAVQGAGVGARLLNELLAFSDAQGVSLIYLNTFAGLDAARHLYECVGFALMHEQQDTTWGVPVREQRFERMINLD
ncbi:MAG: GNAT family N-acetyltransferase [Chloroflexota bacterium]